MKPPAKFTSVHAGLFKYICDCARGAQDSVLEKLREETAALGEIAVMQIGPDQGAFMTLLTRAIGARSALEVGTFTGYSSICLARGLPENGRLLCLDASAEWTAVARRYWKKAGVDHKIKLQIGPAAASLRSLRKKDLFDIAFIDADKTGYDEYYELALPHIRPNGLILFDNMLWGGRLGKGPIREPGGRAIDRLNKKLARDPRVESVLLSVGDGLQICRVRER
ncbi:MAG TPA: class I SAM-dependent methyltransferase [Verrucomicrobiae bacterium]|nr:class I SAM-dependent methyltransferase [Verrucomicrobiae bacterium]